MIAAVIYIALFLVIIFFSPFFDTDIIKSKKLPVIAVFLLKVACGFALTWVYTRYYTDRATADIFKYYDDAKVIYSAFENGKYSDYLRMVFGFANDSPYFDETYYKHMDHWYRLYDFGTYNDDHTIIRFNAFVMLLAFGSFHVHTVVMCFLSLCGLMALYRAFENCLVNKHRIFFVVVFFLPSVLFWGSGVLKEGLLLLSLGYLFYAFFHVFVAKKRVGLNLLILFLALGLLSINKNYLLVAVTPVLICYWAVERFKVKRPLLFYTALYSVAGIGCLVVSSVFMDNKILEALSLKHRDFVAQARGGVFLQNGRQFARIAPDKKEYLDTLGKNSFKIKPGSQYMYWNNENHNDTIFVNNSADTSTYYLVWDIPLAGSALEMGQLKPTIGSLLRTAPVALYHSLCKPGLFSSLSMFEKLAAVENAVILLFLVLCLLYYRRGANKNLFAMCFFLSLSVLLLIGFTAPVAGAIVRYKVPVLPFILLCGILLFDEKRLKIFSDPRRLN